MSTQLETVKPEAVPAIGSFDAAQFDTTVRMAKAIAASSIVPAQYQNNIPNVLVAMEYAHRLGCSVLAICQNLDVIQGRPSLRATFLIGTVNACGRFTPIRFRWEGKKGTDDYGCRAMATDRESGELCEGPLIDWALVKAEKWNAKNGSKWLTMSELMFMYRAGAWWTRVYAPELSLGLHTTDEAEDFSGREINGAVSPLNERINGSIAPAAPEGELPL